MPFPTRFALCATALLAPGAAFAELAELSPIGGSVYNFQLNERISYSCLKLSETDLECSFLRASVSPLLPAEKMAARVAASMEENATPAALEEYASVVCDVVQYVDAKQAKGEMTDVEYMQAPDRDATLKSLRDLCEKRDKASLSAIFELSADIENRTCLISTYSWKGNFSRNDAKTWVRTDKDGPVGDGCGGVYLDRFEQADIGRYWNFIRLAVASNPKGTFTTGEQCSDVYTGKEVEYRWNSTDIPARCDYIRLNLSN